MSAEIADEAPSASEVTDYDRAHLTLYLRLLDAEAAAAAWEEAARILLAIDPAAALERARRRHATHLARAHWMRDSGYLELLKKGR